MNFGRRNGGDSLPTTSGGNNSQPSRFGFGRGSNGQNGSASSIQLQSPVVRAIKKSSRSMRISYGCVACFLFLITVGYRWIRSQNASVWLTCHKQECHLQITPTGFRTGISLHLSRRQLVQALPVKTLADGTFVTAEAIKLNEEWKSRSNKKDKKGKKHSKHQPSSNTYKGPDEHGFYLSYAILLRDKEVTTAGNEPILPVGGIAEDSERDDTDLSPIRQFLDKTDEPGVHRLILRKFRLSQTKRRVRTMTQKVDSYIKKRRHKLLLKENAPPSWQGILICIIGLIGVLMSFLFGQFFEEVGFRSGGPGARRQQQKKPHNYNPHKPKEVDDSVMQTQTPARYEVASGPKPLGMRKRT